MSLTTASNLFQPIQVGNLTLLHRIVLAPMSRLRADASNVPGSLAVEYYTQRASVPGTLLITEATLLNSRAGAHPHVPHIFTDNQIHGWKMVADAVHAKGSFIFMQLWALGRADRTPGADLVGPSDIPVKGRNKIPRPLAVEEIKEFVEMYRVAAANAVHKAGFDGVEVQVANGYLLDQFLQDVSNFRTDQYGGSIENRCRFPLEVLDAVVQAVGQERAALRVSPWSTNEDMGMKDPYPTYIYFISCIRDAYPRLSYLHVIERLVIGDEISPSNDFMREIWQPRRYISCGNYTRESAMEICDRTGELVAFGRFFLANPDLPIRLDRNIPLTNANSSTFYTPMSPVGYIDYTFAPISN